MKKEHALMIFLVLMGVGGIFWFTRSQPMAPVPEKTTQALPSRAADGEAIAWSDYTPGMAQARNQDKNVFLYFYAQWCTYCTLLSETTFVDKKVVAILEEHFVSIAVDTDRNKSLAQSWQVKGLPTLWFLTPEGEKISSLPGYVDAPQFYQILRYIQTGSYHTMSFQEFVNRKPT